MIVDGEHTRTEREGRGDARAALDDGGVLEKNGLSVCNWGVTERAHQGRRFVRWHDWFNVGKWSCVSPDIGGRALGRLCVAAACRRVDVGCGSLFVLGEQLVGPQAEREAQLVGVEVGDRARLGQDELGDVALAGHDLLDALVDVPGHTSRCEMTVRVWPMRQARSRAWSSTAGFHQRSYSTTWLAAVRLSPVPPAFSDSTSAPGPWPFWNSVDHPVAGAAGEAAVVAGDRRRP